MLYTDGSCERVAIDPELIKTQQVKIRPMIGKDQAKVVAQRPNLQYTLVLIASEPVADPLRLNAYNQVLDQNLEISWDAATGSETSYKDIRKTITDAREIRMETLLAGGQWRRAEHLGPVRWSQPDQPRILVVIFPCSPFWVVAPPSKRRCNCRNLTVTNSDEAATVDVDSLAGVEVKSHPFEEMLGGQPGGSLEMARYVPPDRFFVYVGKPESIPALLDSGAPFIASMGTALTGNCLQYNLESRYLARLGMTRDWVDAVLTSGLTSEMAVFAPDLFFIDGTDVTIVAKIETAAVVARAARPAWRIQTRHRVGPGTSDRIGRPRLPCAP